MHPIPPQPCCRRSVNKKLTAMGYTGALFGSGSGLDSANRSVAEAKGIRFGDMKGAPNTAFVDTGDVFNILPSEWVLTRMRVCMCVHAHACFYGWCARTRPSPPVCTCFIASQVALPAGCTALTSSLQGMCAPPIHPGHACRHGGGHALLSNCLSALT